MIHCNAPTLVLNESPSSVTSQHAVQKQSKISNRFPHILLSYCERRCPVPVDLAEQNLPELAPPDLSPTHQHLRPKTASAVHTEKPSSTVATCDATTCRLIITLRVLNSLVRLMSADYPLLLVACDLIATIPPAGEGSGFCRRILSVSAERQLPALCRCHKQLFERGNIRLVSEGNAVTTERSRHHEESRENKSAKNYRTEEDMLRFAKSKQRDDPESCGVVHEGIIRRSFKAQALNASPELTTCPAF